MGCRKKIASLFLFLISFLPLLFISIRKETSLSLFLSLCPRYIYEESFYHSNGFDALGRTRTCPAKHVRVHTHTRAWGDSSCARVFGAHARTHDLRDSDGKRGTRGGGSGARRTHGLHGRELCLARDVKLLAIS